MSKTEARESIKKTIGTGRFDGMHNQVSCDLRMVAKTEGKASANELIDELDLTRIFGIYKVD